MKIFDNKVWHDGEKIGWIDGEHIRDDSGNKLGWFENGFIYNVAGHKIAYIFENELRFENGQPSIPLERLDQMIQGTAPMLEKCAVQVLLEE